MVWLTGIVVISITLINCDDDDDDDDDACRKVIAVLPLPIAAPFFLPLTTPHTPCLCPLQLWPESEDPQ